MHFERWFLLYYVSSSCCLSVYVLNAMKKDISQLHTENWMSQNAHTRSIAARMLIFMD